jgi:hypothetical protein
MRKTLNKLLSVIIALLFIGGFFTLCWCYPISIFIIYGSFIVLVLASIIYETFFN